MKAEKVIKTAPGVLAVKVDYETKQATIGTSKDAKVPKNEILKALESLTYRGEFVDEK